MVIETILFDLDDTLIEELEWARGGWALVARALADRAGRPPAELERMMAGFFAADHGGVLDRLAGAARSRPARSRTASSSTAPAAGRCP